MSEDNDIHNTNPQDANTLKREEKTRVPAQFFQWFDSLRQGYENSINKLFNRVEKVNEDHKEQMKSVYQSQIDSLKKTYQDHLHTLKTTNQSQLEQSQARIKQLEKDAQFYQEQLTSQNKTIDKLNGRYDAVIFALKDKMDNKELENVIKDISPNEQENHPPSIEDGSVDNHHNEQMQEPANNQGHSNETPTAPAAKAQSAPKTEQTAEQTSDNVQTNSPDSQAKVLQTAQHLEEIMNNAFTARQEQQYELAYQLFYSAAIEGNEKAMGAIGRAHFVGEGVPQDKTTGLAWLIKAAEHQFEPAIKKVAGAEQKSPELYQNALRISAELF